MFARGSTPFFLLSLGFIIVIAGILLYLDRLMSLYLALAILPLAALIFFMIFFRDPERVPGKHITAPADGLVESIDRMDEDIRIVIFMNPLNVHVNRMPMNGKLISRTHHDGGYLPAYSKESESNERMVSMFETDIGNVKLVQIAGILVRRIVPYTTVGERYPKGARIGMIRFGSRVDTYLPSKAVVPLVSPGDRTRAGVTPIARVLRDPEPENVPI